MKVITPSSPWNGTVTVEELTDRSRECLNDNLGIEFIEVTENELRGRMPVDQRTTQPAGVLHGGASVAFAETLASWSGFMAVDRERFHVVGQEINANHLRPGKPGWVYGAASPVHIGRRAHVWEIKITDEDGKLICISRCTLAVIEQASVYTAPEGR